MKEPVLVDPEPERTDPIVGSAYGSQGWESRYHSCLGLTLIAIAGTSEGAILASTAKGEKVWIR